MFSPLRLSLCGALLLFASGFNEATAQTLPNSTLGTPSPLTQREMSVRVEAMTAQKELRLQVELHNVNVVKAIEEIANKGHLQVVVKGEVTENLSSLSLQNATPEAVIRKVCDVAGLRCEIKDNVWVISPMMGGGPLENSKKPKIFSLVFNDVKVVDLLSLISAQFDVPIAIGGDVEGRIVFIKIEGKTAHQAIELVALVAELKVEEAQDGTFILSKTVKRLETPLPQPPALQPPAPQHPVPDEAVPSRPTEPTVPPGFMLL